MPFMKFKCNAAQCGETATFVYVVEVGLLAHGRQEMQDTGVDADFIITVVLPGIVLDHVEKLSNKKQDPMFRMILAENEKKINHPNMKQQNNDSSTETKIPPFSSCREIQVPVSLQRKASINSREENGKT